MLAMMKPNLFQNAPTDDPRIISAASDLHTLPSPTEPQHQHTKATTTTTSPSVSSSTTASLPSEQGGTTALPANFVPGPHDVVCARGKSYWDHAGNVTYRALIAAATNKYSQSHNKLDKTLIVSDIVATVEARGGRFVKKESAGKKKCKVTTWVVVDDVFCREKIGQSLRDGLHTQYRSSTKAKKQRLQQANDRINGDIDRVIHSNPHVSQQISQLSHQVQSSHAVSDHSIMTLFSQANTSLLETIKSDQSLLTQFQTATNASAAPTNSSSRSNSPTTSSPTVEDEPGEKVSL